jgi:hypothetical protein
MSKESIETDEDDNHTATSSNNNKELFSNTSYEKSRSIEKSQEE